jgi:hypothetical protein
MGDTVPAQVGDDAELYRAPDALFRWLLDGVLVVTPKMTSPARILAPGDLIWEALAKPITAGAIAESLATLFDVPAETVLADVAPILSQFHEWGAVIAEGQ